MTLRNTMFYLQERKELLVTEVDKVPNQKHPKLR